MAFQCLYCCSKHFRKPPFVNFCSTVFGATWTSAPSLKWHPFRWSFAIERGKNHCEIRRVLWVGKHHSYAGQVAVAQADHWTTKSSCNCCIVPVLICVASTNWTSFAVAATIWWQAEHTASCTCLTAGFTSVWIYVAVQISLTGTLFVHHATSKAFAVFLSTFLPVTGKMWCYPMCFISPLHTP